MNYDVGTTWEMHCRPKIIPFCIFHVLVISSWAKDLILEEHFAFGTLFSFYEIISFIAGLCMTVESCHSVHEPHAHQVKSSLG